MNQSDIQAVKDYLLKLQDNICNELAAEDGKEKFIEDAWSRDKEADEDNEEANQTEVSEQHDGPVLGGGGRSRVLTEGEVFEQAGINFSHVHGDKLPASATANRPELEGRSFQAMGVSLVIHPNNPYVPTSHANVRFFVAEKEGEEPVWWFGGGFDLTPFYPFKEDVVHWHTIAKEACDPFGEDIYAKYKKWCDEYFYLKHRDETRGVGGLFFDDLNEWGFEKSFDFMKSVGDSYINAYRPIVKRRKDMMFGKRERDFQLYRRGRYVEFNLLYDRGTIFGLQTGGRTESILMSMPPLVKFKYNWSPKENSPEANLYKKYLTPKEWIK